MQHYLSINVLRCMKFPRVRCIILHEEELASAILAASEHISAYIGRADWKRYPLFVDCGIVSTIGRQCLNLEICPLKHTYDEDRS